MTVNKASSIFNLSEKDIRKCLKDGMVKGAYKENNRWIIPDETRIILTKEQIQKFLFQIIKFKNNHNIVVSKNLCRDADELAILFNYLYEQGFLGEYVFSSDVKTLFNDVQLTDEGLALLMGSYYNKINVNFNGDFNLFRVSLV